MGETDKPMPVTAMGRTDLIAELDKLRTALFRAEVEKKELAEDVADARKVSQSLRAEMAAYKEEVRTIGGSHERIDIVEAVSRVRGAEAKCDHYREQRMYAEAAERVATTAAVQLALKLTEVERELAAAKELIRDQSQQILTASSTIPRWRPEVAWFADAMEAKLKANDHKGQG